LPAHVTYRLRCDFIIASIVKIAKSSEAGSSITLPVIRDLLNPTPGCKWSAILASQPAALPK
jgi:hypothetical protein